MTSSTIIDLVERYFDNYDCSDDDNDISENVHSMLDEYVSCNHYKVNIEIINNEVGDIFSGIKLYEDNYGPFVNISEMNKVHFYSLIAYNCLESNLIDAINEKLKEIDDIVDSSSDTD